MDNLIQYPILFNCWKHHAGYIKEQISKISEGNRHSFDTVIKNLQIIGGSQMDLYTGLIKPDEVAHGIIRKLVQNAVLEADTYKNWIRSENLDYKLILLPDNSSWTLRIAPENERYVHIHPSRYSDKSVRIKSTTLKSAIAFLAWQKYCETNEINLEGINYVRKVFLNESPLKSINSSESIVKIIKLLTGKQH